MCCFYTVLLMLGPRVAIVIWWFMEPQRWQATFNSIIWPILGIILAPWTTLMYVLVAPGGVIGWDWLWIGLAVMADVSFYAGGGYGNRDRLSG
jgi:hypothetical protein